jgi:hypothetical protein
VLLSHIAPLCCSFTLLMLLLVRHMTIGSLHCVMLLVLMLGLLLIAPITLMVLLLVCHITNAIVGDVHCILRYMPKPFPPMFFLHCYFHYKCFVEVLPPSPSPCRWCVGGPSCCTFPTNKYSPLPFPPCVTW